MAIRARVKKWARDPQLNNRAQFEILNRHIDKLIAEQPHNAERLTRLKTWAKGRLS